MSAFWRKREVIPWVSRFRLIPPWGEAAKEFNRGKKKPIPFSGEDEEEGRRFMEGGRVILPPIKKPVYFLKIALGIMAWIPLFPSTIWVIRKSTARLDRE